MGSTAGSRPDKPQGPGLGGQLSRQEAAVLGEGSALVKVSLPFPDRSASHVGFRGEFGFALLDFVLCHGEWLEDLNQG